MKTPKFKIIKNPTDIEVGQIWYGKSVNHTIKYLVKITELDDVNLIVKWERLDGKNTEGQLDVLGGFLSDYKLTDLPKI